MTLRALKIFALGLLVLALSACSTGGSADPLNGTNWALASIDGAPVIPDSAVTAQFIDGTIGGSSGCNSYGGKYQLSGENLRTSEIVSTLMACAEQSMMDQESAFLGALNNAATFRVTGNKLEIMTSDGKTLAFDRQ